MKNALIEALHVGLGALFILPGLALIADFKGLTSRAVRLQYAFQSMFGRGGRDEETSLGFLSILARGIGVMLLAGGVYTVVLAIAVWPHTA